jgi:hypothetical protein
MWKVYWLIPKVIIDWSERKFAQEEGEDKLNYIDLRTKNIKYISIEFIMMKE